MTTKPAAVFALLALGLAAQSACAPPTRPTAPATGVRAISPEVVPVASGAGPSDRELPARGSGSGGAAAIDTALVTSPTGETETDRASILAALDEVEPGGMILFGPGTYLVGEAITVAVPEVTLLGHPDLRSESDPVRDLGSGNRVTTGAATSADPQPVAQQPRTITERLVDVGGFQMQVWTGGPRPSEGGPPLVVFENGRAGIADTWAEVAEEVASFAPFLAYNRGGRGLSEWDGVPPTPEHVARRLRDLLDVLDLSPPYLLVGHSWGAHLVREHAALHPDAVAGLVYVDPYAPCAVERAFETAGFGPLVAEFTDFLAQRSGPAPDPLHLRMDRELGSGAPPDIPVVLMVGLKEGPPPPGAREWIVERGIDPDEILTARRELKVLCLSSMALEVPRGKLIATPFSGHDIQHDEPELVVEAIRWVLSRMPSPGGQPTGNVEVVPVAPPTGEKEIDRASILAALERVRPGDTVQFAAGTYLVGESMRIATPRISLLGHAGGTVLRGCDRDEQEEVERRAVQALVSGDQATYRTMSRRCGLLELTGGNVTVRGLTFEHARTGLVLACCEGEEVSEDGGYLVEGNTFRNSANGIRASVVSAEPTVIRGNRFVNVFHALSAGVSRVQMLDNDISVPEPERVPGTGHPGFAIGIRPPPPGPADGTRSGPPVCEQDVIAGNRIEGHTDGILLRAFDPETSCRDNTVRDNVIEVRRVPVPVPWLYADLLPLTNETDTTFVGVPLGLLNFAARAADADGDAERGGVENNLFEGNRVCGTHGVGIQVLDASRNRIANNTLTGIRRRDPFPGNITTGSQEWGEANGSAIWISPGSDGNEIIGNEFEDVASSAVVIAGDDNRVQLTNPSDAVRDLGTGNRVSGPDTTTSPLAYENQFIDAGGVRLHYLDFGGEGLPLVLVHSEGWDAHTYEDFAPRFNDANRVLAVTRPGYGESEAHPEGFDVAAQAKSLIDFLDALGIERAVFAGNSSPTVHLTYLAEHHPDRVAGVIYLAGLLTHWLGDEVRESDPTGARVMAARANALDATARERLEALMSHRPEFLAGDRPPMEVRALAFVGRSGTIGYERFSGPRRARRAGTIPPRVGRSAASRPARRVHCRRLRVP